MKKTHHPKFTEQVFFFLSGGLVASLLPPFYRKATEYLHKIHVTNFYIGIIEASIFAPTLEEFAKSYPLFYRHGETEKSLFRLGFLSGLGFGLVEFFIYVLVHHVSVWERLPGLFFHATNTSIVAFGIGKNHILRYYGFAVFLHFLNNFTANYGPYWYILGILATGVSYIASLYLSRRVTDRVIASAEL